jgi:hypothetical protein
MDNYFDEEQYTKDAAACDALLRKVRHDRSSRLVYKTFDNSGLPQPAVRLTAADVAQQWKDYIAAEIESRVGEVVKELQAVHDLSVEANNDLVREADEGFQNCSIWLEKLEDQVSSIMTRLQVVEATQRGEVVALPKAKSDAA